MSSFCHPDKITVNPNRFRIVTVEDQVVKDMAESIKDIGQLNAILVDKDMDLIDGLNRLMACKLLNRDVWFVTDVEGNLVIDNPMLRRVAEHQANFRRSDFSPSQTAKAIEEIHSLMVSVYGEGKRGPGNIECWTQKDTAKKLGYKSHGTVSDAIFLVKAIEHNVPGIVEAKSTQEALSIAKKAVRLEAAVEKAKRESASGETGEIQNPLKYFGDRIILGDCREKLKELPSSICNLFITDPPWKIGIDKAVDDHGSGEQKAVGNYDDSSDDVIPLVKSVMTEMWRVGKPDCYVVMFCGIEHFDDLKKHFKETGFQVYKKPLVWVKTGGNNGLCSSKSPAPSIWPASVTDFMILARKGAPVLAQLHKGDAFLQPPQQSSDRCHQAQKPIPLMEEIIGRFYYLGTNPLLIDPFAGSGSTLTAARRVGIKQYFGYELSAVNRDRAVAEMVNQYMKEQEQPAPITATELEKFD